MTMKTVTTTMPTSRSVLLLLLVPLFASGFSGPSYVPGRKTTTTTTTSQVNPQNIHDRYDIGERSGSHAPSLPFMTRKSQRDHHHYHSSTTLFAASSPPQKNDQIMINNMDQWNEAKDTFFGKVNTFFKSMFGGNNQTSMDDAENLKNAMEQSRSEMARLLEEADLAMDHANAALALVDLENDLDLDYDDDVDAKTASVVAAKTAAEKVEEITAATKSSIASITADAPMIMTTTAKPKTTKKKTKGGASVTPSVEVQPIIWSQLTVVKLKAELKSRGLAVSGKKADLIARLEASAGVIVDGGDDDDKVETANVAKEEEETPDWATFNVAQLKQELKRRGLAVSGKKADLISRLSLSSSSSETTTTTKTKAAKTTRPTPPPRTEPVDVASNLLESIATIEPRPYFAMVMKDDNVNDDEAVVEPQPQQKSSSSTMDFTKLTVAQLKDELRNKGLRVSGKKVELIERLETAS